MQSRCEFESRSGEVYSIQQYVMKSVSALRQVGGFLRVLQVPPPIKLTANDITEILLKMALNTIYHTKPNRVMDLFSKNMKRLYIIYMLPLNYAILDYHSIYIYIYIYTSEN